MYVTTRYYGATDHKGPRIRVSWRGERKFIPYAYEAISEHQYAARKAAEAWGFVVHGVEYLTDSESGRGGVYELDVTIKELGE